VAGTVTYVDLSDASRAVIASLQPVAFLSFIQTIAADRPSIYRCYSSSIYYSISGRCFSIACCRHNDLILIIVPAVLKWIVYVIMRYNHDDKVPFAVTTQVSVAVFVVATKVEATAASVPPQFLDLLQLQHRSACCH
jgi:hypothetical protein